MSPHNHALELPDDLRIPLHELQADAPYLVGRVAAENDMAGLILQTLETKLGHIAEAAYRLNGERADMLAALNRIREWIRQLPIPTEGATHMLGVVSSVISKAEAR
jgi:hypothetical protein